MNDNYDMPPIMKTCWDCGLTYDLAKRRSVLCPHCTDIVEAEDRRWAEIAWDYLAKQFAPNQQNRLH